MQPSHSSGFPSETLWIMGFYSRVGTVYLLKNRRKEEIQAAFQTITFARRFYLHGRPSAIQLMN